MGLSKKSKLSLDQGKFLRSRRLKELNLKLSDKVTPGDGSCMFHAILDQIQNIPSLQDYASSHFELRWKIVSDGYKCFLETDKLEWPNDPMCGSKRNWKTEMLDPTTWGDEVVLSLAKNQAIHLFHFSESDFISAHYESVFPRSDDEVTDMSIPPAYELTDEIISMTEEDIRNCQFLITEESIRDLQVVVTTNTDHPR